MSQEEGGGDRLLRLCALISEKVTPRGERKKTHHHRHRHIWKEQSRHEFITCTGESIIFFFSESTLNAAQSSCLHQQVNNAMLTLASQTKVAPHSVSISMTDGGVTHLFSSPVQPFLFVSAHLHTGEQVTDCGQRQALLHTGSTKSVQ